MDDNKKFFINTLRNIVKTDKGFCLQQVYYENENGQLLETQESTNNPNKNHFSKNCFRCIHIHCNEYCSLRLKLENLTKKNCIPCNWVANCDAYSPVMPLNIIKSKEEMIQFVEKTECFFDCPENYESYFGFERKWNENTGDILETVREYYNRGGKFNYIPDKFPCVIYFGIVDFNGERCNNEKLDWIYIG